MDKPDDNDLLLRVEQVAVYLDISPKTLEKWRNQGRGPDYVKIGSLVRYQQSAVERWIEAKTVRHG